MDRENHASRWISVNLVLHCLFDVAHGVPYTASILLSRYILGPHSSLKDRHCDLLHRVSRVPVDARVQVAKREPCII